jgi:hypothetical protein
MKPYRKRLLLNVDHGAPDTWLLTSGNLLVAMGYNRVVIGKRGPYVEFESSHILWNGFFVPNDQLYRHTSNVVYYEEWRSKDEARVKLYRQKRTVAYADYKIDKIYISPFDLYFTNRKMVIE